MKTCREILDNAIDELLELSEKKQCRLEQLHNENRHSHQEIFPEDQELIDRYDAELEELDKAISALENL